jgi:hypothetical protein
MKAQSSLGDRAVLIAVALAVVLVGLLGTGPEPAAEEPAGTAQVANR